MALLAAIGAGGCAGAGDPDDPLSPGQQAALCREAKRAADEIAREHPNAPAEALEAEAEAICKNGAHPAPGQ